MEVHSLKQSLSVLQELVYFDEEQYYREQTKNPEAVRKLIAALEVKRQEGGEETYFLLSMLGYCYRVINEPKQAIAVLKEDITAFMDDKKRMVTLIRLGEAYKYDSQYQMALHSFVQAEEILRENNFLAYEDFLYQHQAKCYFELQNLEKAEILFQKALEIRKKRQDESLIHSTRQVLEEVIKRKQGEINKLNSNNKMKEKKLYHTSFS